MVYRGLYSCRQWVRFITLFPNIFLLSPGQMIATCQRNMSQHCWAQHVACVWPPCCDMLGVVGSNLTIFKFEQQHPTCRNTLQHAGQTHATCCAQQCCDMLRWHVAIVWPGLYCFCMLSEFAKVFERKV